MIPKDISEALDTIHFQPFRDITTRTSVHRVCTLKLGKDGASEATTAQRSEVQVTPREVEQSRAQKGARDEGPL